VEIAKELGAILMGQGEPPTQPPQTFAERITRFLEQFAEQQKSTIQAASKRMNAAAAKALAAVNDLLRRLQKK
jgi:hypothetical protein